MSSTFTRSVLVLAFVATAFAAGARAQRVKRVVVLKIDGLPGYYLDGVVKKRDPATGKSVLPWVEEIFYKNGTRVPNFYTRGMSISGPSWGQLDTGHRAQIKGNVEFDRLTLHAYDYLNFVPFYVDYGKNKKVDMPATEVMDQLKIPLLCDAFDVERRYTAQQLYQRGYDWAVFASGFVNMIPRDRGDLIDEWTIGFNFRKMTVNQLERDIEGKLIKRDDIDYFDYYDTSFDHMSHHNNDAESRLVPLRELDRTIGRIWSSIALSKRADETALVLVSDHGFNSDERIYSQGFNLVKLLTARSGGGHHVITKRRLLLDYSIKGFYPLVPLIRTSSHESYYLKGQNSKYPTALVDFDGNERSSIHLRQSDLNVIHILLQELKRGSAINADVRAASADAVMSIIEKHRVQWQTIVSETREELSALARWRVREASDLEPLAMRSGNGVSRREAEESRRRKEQVNLALEAETQYREHLQSLSNLLALKRADLLSRQFDIEDLIAPDSMGEANTIYDLQNYVVGLGEQGIVTDANGKLDFAKTFQRVNYFELFHTQRVRNNVQNGVGNQPVDFVAARISPADLDNNFANELKPTEEVVWLYDGDDKQALILTRETNGARSYRYLPIANLRQNERGKFSFERRDLTDGFPLRYFEDLGLNITGDRRTWLTDWHGDVEWLRGVHNTTYSNAIIGLTTQLDRHPLPQVEDATPDDDLIRRFRQRQRRMTEADLLIVSNDHWNFDVRGFNPGGNHGSFLRVSTNATLMIAGGANTGIRRSFVVNEPYDSLSFAPTIFWLMGKTDDQGNPTPELRSRGFHKFPGRIISEITGH
ncbi:MAG: alkaline phosphatase family protein [Pyrinomonadaceae bacterium]